MGMTEVEDDVFYQIDKDHYLAQIQELIDFFIPQFKRIVSSYIRFNIFYFLLIFCQISALAFFLGSFSRSYMLALSLAGLFLTGFSYFILRLYFQAKKPEQILDLLDRYIEASQSVLSFVEGIPEHHSALAQSCCKLAAGLHGFEYNQFQLPSWLEILSPSLEKLSCWCYWHDVYKTKEVLLLLSVDEHIKMVKYEPTCPDMHTALANSYIMLSGLYADPRKLEGYDEERWMPRERYDPQMQQKFRAAAERAIEEFKILSEYAPNDPWVHAQLAYSYQDLQMPLEEIREYEIILKLRPDDKETLYKLGVLYFSQGFNAKGLRVYDQLKHYNYKKAEHLIQFYGAYSPILNS